MRYMIKAGPEKIYYESNDGLLAGNEVRSFPFGQ